LRGESQEVLVQKRKKRKHPSALIGLRAEVSRGKGGSQGMPGSESVGGTHGQHGRKSDKTRKSNGKRPLRSTWVGRTVITHF